MAQLNFSLGRSPPSFQQQEWRSCALGQGLAVELLQADYFCWLTYDLSRVTLWPSPYLLLRIELFWKKICVYRHHEADMKSWVSPAWLCPCEHMGTWQHMGSLHLGKTGMKSSGEATLLCYVLSHFWPLGKGATHRHCLRCLRCGILLWSWQTHAYISDRINTHAIVAHDLSEPVCFFPWPTPLGKSNSDTIPCIYFSYWVMGKQREWLFMQEESPFYWNMLWNIWGHVSTHFLCPGMLHC